LFQLLVFAFLVLDVFPDNRFVSTYGRDKIPARPEAFSDEPAPSFAVSSRKMDRALAFDLPNHLTDAYFGGIANNM
jgi:hypothetical protein